MDPANRVGKPYSLDRLIIESALQFDHGAVPRCMASDAELLARGQAACPRDSVVQRGRIVLDTGSPLVVPRLIGLRTTTFNAAGGYLHLGEGDTFPMRGTARSTVRDGVVEVDYADAPGWGGPDPWAAMTIMESFGRAIVRDGRAFVRTPRTCPPTRSWTTHYTFVYHDGVRQRETTVARCRPQRMRRRS